ERHHHGEIAVPVAVDVRGHHGGRCTGKRQRQIAERELLPRRGGRVDGGEEEGDEEDRCEGRSDRHLDQVDHVQVSRLERRWRRRDVTAPHPLAPSPTPSRPTGRGGTRAGQSVENRAGGVGPPEEYVACTEQYSTLSDHSPPSRPPGVSYALPKVESSRLPVPASFESVENLQSGSRKMEQ